MSTMYREILVFVIGTTPQIITETMYAMINREEVIIPDEVYIITTMTGMKCIEEELIKKDHFRTFCREFAISPDIIKEDSFILISDEESKPLEDIRTKEHNEIAGDTIVNFIKDKTFDMRTRLHCSIAGGRKTMSFYMGSAMQLFGRPWDKLYHVLVSPEFESNPEFYYKPTKNKTISIRDRNGNITKTLNTKDAVIDLAELPFIRLREKVPLYGKTFKELIRESQQEIDTAMTQPLLTVKLKDRIISIGDILIVCEPLPLVLYTYFLRQKLHACVYPNNTYCFDCSECYTHIDVLSNEEAFEDILRDYTAIYGSLSGMIERFRQIWNNNKIDRERIRSGISKINRDIKEALNDGTLSTIYTITSKRRYGDTRYGIQVEKGKIRMEE